MDIKIDIQPKEIDVKFDQLMVGTNIAPVAADDSVTTPFETSVLIDVLANDTDADPGDTLSIQSVGTPSNGTAVIEAGQIRYTPNNGFSGADSFTYVATDGTATDNATVNVTVEEQPFAFGNGLVGQHSAFARIPNTAGEIDGLQKFSISIWCNTSDGVQEATIQCEKSSQERLAFVWFKTGILYFIINDGGPQYGQVDLSDYGVKKHLVAVFDGTKTGNSERCKIYVDAAEQSLSFTNTIPSSIDSNINANLEIGKYNPTSEYDGGMKDETAIYYGALTPSDVAKLWNNGAGLRADDDSLSISPQYYYRMNHEEPATHLIDEMGNKDAELVNYSNDYFQPFDV